MLRLRRLSSLAAAIAVALLFPVDQAVAQTAAKPSTLPHLEHRGESTQLIVNSQPYLVLGGELHNSSSSSVEHMKSVWPQMTALHLNTVLLPVAWETIEPTEGQFDFTNVDGLLQGARENHLKLVILWFGAWKNTYSSYVPAWVKINTERFPRVQLSDGRSTERLSPFSKSVRDADARAFAKLMAHVRDIDKEAHTVLMVQVENEVGVLPESRDHSAVADAAFKAPVPTALMSSLQKSKSALNPEFRAEWEAAGAKTLGTWQEVFGSGSQTDDFFMAWNYATYIDRVTAAGKAEYQLPMFTNAALIRPNYEPGQFNSGGPLPHSMDIWKAGAPSLDFLSPDIYFNEFSLWAGLYTRHDNPLFVPETQGGTTGAANALYAFGHLSALGFSPFGIDDQNNAPLDLVGVTRLGEHVDSTAIRDVYTTLSHLASGILEKQSTRSINAALMEGEAQRAARLTIGDYTANITRAGNTPGSRVAAMFLQTSPNEFLVTGVADSQVTFTSDKPGLPIVGIESIDEMFYENGKWTPQRRLNGDENSQGQSLRLYAEDQRQGRIYRVRLYRYR